MYDDACYQLYPEISDDKFAHMRAVADKMRNRALEMGWGIERANDMYLLGLLHDIGYAVNRAEHSASGAELLERNGYRYAHEVALHGKLSVAPSPELELLWWADLTCDHIGTDVSIDARIGDICARYGGDSRQYVNALEIAKILKRKGWL